MKSIPVNITGELIVLPRLFMVDPAISLQVAWEESPVW